MADNKASEPKPQPAKKGGGKKMIIFALLGLVLLGGGIGAGMMLSGKKGKTEKAATEKKAEGEKSGEAVEGEGGESTESAEHEAGEEGEGEGEKAKEGEGEGEAKAGGHGGGEAKAEGGEGGEKTKKTAGNFFQLDPPFMVNLAEVGGRRFLKVSIVLEIKKTISPDVVEAKKPPIRDAIILLLSEKSFVDINTMEGKEKLKYEIIKRCNVYLKKGTVENVHFTEFLIQ